MAVTLDNHQTTSGTNISSLTGSITVASNANRYLTCRMESGDDSVPSVTSITFNTSESLGEIISQTDAAFTVATVEIWDLVAPTATTANVVITMNTTCNHIASTISSYYNVDQSTPHGTAVSGTATSGSTHARAVADTVTDGRVIGVAQLISGPNASRNITTTDTQDGEVNNIDTSGNFDSFSAASDAGTGASVTINWGGTNLGTIFSWTSCGVCIRPAPSEATGTLSATLAAATLSATGTVSIAGSLNSTLGALTLSGAGAVSLTGALDASLAALTLSGTGLTEIVGSATATLDAATLGGDGTVAIAGSAAPTFDALTLDGVGAVSLAGALSATLGDVTLSGQADVALDGSLAATLAALTTNAAGTVADGPLGALETTLAALTLSATGEVSGASATPAPTPTPTTGTGGGGSAGPAWLRGKLRRDVRRTIKQALAELRATRSTRSRKRKARRIAQEIAPQLTFDVPLASLPRMPDVAMLEPIRLQILNVTLKLREKELAADKQRAYADEMAQLFAAYEQEAKRLDQQEEEEAVALVIALIS